MTQSRDIHRGAPRRALTIGMWLFLASLGMLFFAGMLLYVMSYLHVFGNIATAKVHLPAGAWGSTVVLLGLSVAMHQAVVNVRLERQALLRRWLYITTALALVFLIVQTPCLVILFHEHVAAQAKAAADIAASAAATHNQSGKALITPLPQNGFVFCLIFLHALHVIGGLGAMAIVIPHAFQGKYDHEDYLGLHHAALYWHFLDAVWLVMFVVFTITG